MFTRCRNCCGVKSGKLGSKRAFAAPSTKVRNGPEVAFGPLSSYGGFVRLAPVRPGTDERQVWAESGI
jgi:hypothetical protein